MEKIVRNFKILKKDKRKSNPEILEDLNFSKENNLSFVRLGSLEKSQSLEEGRKEEEEEGELPERRRLLRPESVRSCPGDYNLEEGFDDLDDATADMMAMFRGLESQCSSARSSIKSKYSIQFDTDNSEEEEPEHDQIEEELPRANFPGNERFSMFFGQNAESR